MKSKTIFIVVNSTRNYQTKRVLLAKKTANLGHDVHIVTPEDATEQIDRFEHHTFPLDRQGMNPVDELQSIASLRSLYKEHEPDLVHHFTIKPILYGGVAARLANVPAAVHGVTGLGHAFIADSPKGKALKKIVKTGYRLIKSHPNQRIIFQNPDDLEYFVSSGLVTKSNACLVRSSGVDPTVYTPNNADNDVPVVVLPARMLWAKGIEEFVQAAKEVQNQGTEARFALVGDTDSGNPGAIPSTELQQWDESGIIEWWGWQDDMVSVYHQSDIVCLPSYYPEGVPQVLLEGAACSKPLVTTDVPGCREAVIDGENGYIVPPKDATQLADQLTKLITNPDLRQSMGQQGRTLVENEFSREVVVDRTIDVYEELI